MLYSRGSGGLLALALALPACFDSDQKFKLAETTSTSTSTSTTTTSTTAPSTETTSSGTGPDGTCRDAIECIYNCAAMIAGQMQANPDLEPDLTCFLDCEEQLSVPEVKKLLEFASCCSMICEAEGECGGGSSSSGGESSSSGGSSSSSSSSTTSGGGDGPPPLLDPCLQCVFVHMLDEESPGCEPFAMACPD
jgi:hypothetical protein